MPLSGIKSLPRQVLSIADQLVVSGANFLMLLGVTRWASVTDVGYYAVTLSIIFLATAAQDALVTRPFTVQLHQSGTNTPERAGGSLAFAVLFAIGLSVAVFFSVAILDLLGVSAGALTIVLAMAVAIPPILLREFVRRYSLAHLQIERALAVDAATMSLAGLGFLLLGHFGILTAATAIMALAAGSVLPVAGWFYVTHREFRFSKEGFRATVTKSVAFGKWLLVGQIAMQARSYATHWITLVMGGPAVTGLYSACVSIIALSNPVLFGYYNGLTPLFVRTLKDKGPVALCRSAAMSALFLTAIMGLFAACIYFQGEAIMGLLFPGKEYRAGAEILNLLAAASVIAALGGPAMTALIAAEKGRIIAYLNIAVSLFGFLLVTLAMIRGGLTEAAIAVVITELFGTAAEWLALVITVLPKSRTLFTPAVLKPDRGQN